MQRYLTSFFKTKDEGVSVIEDKLRYHLTSHKEQARRENMAATTKVCNQTFVEQYYLQMLSLHLD